MARGDRDRALRVFENVLVADPRCERAQGRLAWIHAGAGEHRLACRHYRAALKLAPDCFEYAVGLADSLRRLGETSMNRPLICASAVRAYAHARWLDPDDFHAALGMGICYVKLGRLDLAEEAFRDARAIDPSAPETHVALARVGLMCGELEQALGECQAALRLDTEHLAAHNVAAEVCLAMKDQPDTKVALARERASAHLRKSLDLDPDQPHVRAVLAGLEACAVPMAAAVAERGMDTE